MPVRHGPILPGSPPRNAQPATPQHVPKNGYAWLLHCQVQERKALTRFGEFKIPIPPSSGESKPMSRLMLRGRVQTMLRPFLSAACQPFLFADEMVSITIPCEAHMARGIATTTDTCRQPGDGAGSSAHGLTRAKLTGNS